jgi:hypothetical protein
MTDFKIESKVIYPKVKGIDGMDGADQMLARTAFARGAASERRNQS